MELGMVKPIKPTITFSGSDKAEEPKKSVDAKEKLDSFNKEMNGANEALRDTTKEVGLFGATATGLWAAVKKPFTGVVEWLKDAKLDKETGEKIMSETINKKKALGLAGAVAAAVGALAISKIVKAKKAEKAEKAEKAQAAEEQAKIQEKKNNDEVEMMKAEAEKAKAEAEKAKAEAEKFKADAVHTEETEEED